MIPRSFDIIIIALFLLLPLFPLPCSLSFSLTKWTNNPHLPSFFVKEQQKQQQQQNRLTKRRQGEICTSRIPRQRQRRQRQQQQKTRIFGSREEEEGEEDWPNNQNKNSNHNNINNTNNNKQIRKKASIFIDISSYHTQPVRTSNNKDNNDNDDDDENVTLTDYMRLPVDQYVCVNIPLSARLERIQSNLFSLTVPDIKFFHIVCSPLVKANVFQTYDSVKIESTDVILQGSSSFVESLNGCYDFRVSSQFGWIDDSNALSLSSSSSGETIHKEKRSSSNDDDDDEYSCGSGSSIHSTSRIQVYVDPPPPFKYLPKRLLESTGRIALKVALDQIEKAFLRALAADYEMWATSKEYRKTRSNMEILDVLEE